MTFYSSMFFGFCVGVLAVFGFRKVQRHKSGQRLQRAVHNAMLAAMNKDDLAKLLPKALFPSWVQFQDLERVRWFNMQLKELWPHINKATRDTIMEVVEPMMNQDYRPAIVASLKFKTLTLGNVPPEIEGVQVVNTGQDRIELLFQFKWSGNPSIILSIKTVMGPSVSIQVANLRIWGTLRVILAPLVDQLPCIGAISASLTDKPHVTYRVKVIGAGVVGGDINSIPGLGSAIDTVIMDTINDSLVWPCRILVPIMPGDYRDLEMKEVAKLDVTVVEAKMDGTGQGVLDSLVEKAVGKTIDLFARIYIRRVRTCIGDTFCDMNTDHPLWGQAFQLTVEDKSTQKLTIEILAKGELGQSTTLGTAIIALADLKELSVEDLWKDVYQYSKNEVKGDDPKKIGQVHVEVSYRPLGPDGKPTDPLMEFTDLMRPSANRTLAEVAAAQQALSMPSTSDGGLSYIRGVISVTVLRGRNLVSRDTNGLSDPFVVVYCLKHPDVRKKSKVLFKTLDPEWNQKFDLVVDDARNDMVIVKVYDHDLLGMKEDMGWVALTLTKVIRNRVIEDTFKLEEGGEGSLDMRLGWRPVPL